MDRFLQEFRNSAIPDSLTLANIQWIEGDAAIALLTEQAISKVQRVREYVTIPARSILKRYQFAEDGGWFAMGTSIDGGVGAVPYFKPANPRTVLDGKKIKKIKYETPQGCEALPLLPFVDQGTAAAIYARYQVSPSLGETFWQVVKRGKLPIALTEGLKKALALIAHGIPAIAIRGITQWRKKGGLELHDCIASFADGRQFYIVFDQDEKPTTQRNVKIQALKLGAELKKLGCKVGIPTWDLRLGKGIDDVLSAQGGDAQSWLDQLIADSPTLTKYKQHDGVAAALAAIVKQNSLSFSTERETEGEYLPELPLLEQGAIHVVDASMGSGKTTRIGADWVSAAKALGWFTVVLTPINNLGRQSAAAWNLPHIHDYSKSGEGERQLWQDVRSRGGIVLCPDSLLRLPQWIFSMPLLLVLDEANQVADHATQGDTLGYKYSPVLECFGEIAKYAAGTGAIVLSEAQLPDRAVKFIKSLSQCDRVRVFKHRKVGVPWDCTVFTGQASGYRARLLKEIAKGEPILVVTSSQQEGRRLDKVIGKRYPNTKVKRIDSETNQQGAFSEFFANPDGWLKAHKPDILILSPSTKSGVSIEGGVRVDDACFKSVWGYFPALATDTHLQLLGRYRPSVPRFVFAPPFIQTSGDESLYSARAIKQRLGLNQQALSAAYALDSLLDADEPRSETLLRIENAVFDYLAEARAISGAQKSIAHAALVDSLERAGHHCTCEKVESDREITTLWKETQEEIWREDAAEFAAAKVEPHHTPAWAMAILDSFDSLRADRIIAQKVLCREQFPGILFDCPDECYGALFNEYGKMRQGVVAQAKVENLQASKEDDRGQVEAILKARIRGTHKLPKSYVRSLLLHKTGILDLLDAPSYSNTSKLAIDIKKRALHFAREISYWLRLNLTDDQTPVEIANKLLKKFGLKGKEISRIGKRGQQQRIYQVEGQDNPLRIRLLKAARRRLSGGVAVICNGDSLHPIQITATATLSPTTQGFEGTPLSGSPPPNRVGDNSGGFINPILPKISTPRPQIAA